MQGLNKPYWLLLACGLLALPLNKAWAEKCPKR